MMPETVAERVISTFALTKDQRTAALERGRDVVVTAGAGSGKTRTLVARYLSLLADGFPPRRVVAITFTEKAAREMRSRIRDALQKLEQSVTVESERQQWIALSSQIDSARISTIHGLCSEILRTHPAEAGIDPRFDVLDEGACAALQVQVVDDMLNALVRQREYIPLFRTVKTSGIRELFIYLLNHRLESQEVFVATVDGASVIHRIIESAMSTELIRDLLAELRSVDTAMLRASGEKKLPDMLTDLLSLWSGAEGELARGDTVACAENLYQVRRNCMVGNVGKKDSPVKAAIQALRAAYDRLLNPLIGGAQSGDPLPSHEAEELLGQIQPLVRTAFEYLLQTYQGALRQRRALDFDDLEFRAVQLLRHPEIRARWQGEIDALLVDEFQDTNARQRELVEALTGAPGRLFVVGDARQSIYRFRRADVTVFRSFQEQIRAQGGLVLNLDITFRAHDPLLAATGDLLSPIMGTDPDPLRPYYVPFSPLRANRSIEPDHIPAPHIEFVFGAGEDISTARPTAARALAARLIELEANKQIRNWDDVALLFRASSGFAYYEDAFEDAGIPFVTVAGSGFYERPEIRDVLNLLKALVNPTDDLAMAGLLCSPAFGLSRAALYLLRIHEGEAQSYWEALHGDMPGLSEFDRMRASNAVQVIDSLLPQVDRVPVAELLKSLVDATDYRAILAAEDGVGTGGRLWRNLDKLIADAQASGQMSVRDFIDYLATLSDSGAREGEASAEAQGAVRLMTIHKSKGLEFPIVVLADANRSPKGGHDAAYLLSETGLCFKLEPSAMLYRFSKWLDKQQVDAEVQRLLYVALTRAKDKLLISGHMAPARGGGSMATSAWMNDLCEATGLDIQNLYDRCGEEIEIKTISGYVIRAWCPPRDYSGIALMKNQESIVPPEPNIPSLYLSFGTPLPTIILEDESDIVANWRVTGNKVHAPQSVIGQMVHKAIELWLFPDDSRLIPLLETAALNAGLVSQEQRSEAVQRARELLERLQAHPLWNELDKSLQRYHEIPYSYLAKNRVESGYIDLVYQDAGTWRVLDFKTDSIRSMKEREELIRFYSRQMSRYSNAVEMLMGKPAQVMICFLDDNGKVSVLEC